MFRVAGCQPGKLDSQTRPEYVDRRHFKVCLRHTLVIELKVETREAARERWREIDR